MPLLLTIALNALLALPQQVAADLPKSFRAHTTPDYTIHTDLDKDAIREATLRMTKMAAEYRSRTAGFTKKATTRLPFYLFKNPKDYYAAGGPPRSGGVYRGNALMAVVGSDPTRSSWPIVQHEGWHQFVHRAIGGDIPVWVNEGMAEYFGDAIFTGDGYVVGYVPTGRLKRVKALIEQKHYKPFAEMMTIRSTSWLHQMSRANYDQAWSMVYFLAYADNNKYRSRLDRFLKDVSLKGGSWQRSWKDSFGTDVAAFEGAWQKYWIAQPLDSGKLLFNEAVFSTFTSFLARAVSQGQLFDDADAFFAAADRGGLKMNSKDWLPDSLLKWALRWRERIGECSFERQRSNVKALVCVMENGDRWHGSWKTSRGRVGKVNIVRTTR